VNIETGKMSLLKPVAGALLAISLAGVANVSLAGAPEKADVMIQGGGGVYAENGTTLVRQPGGLRVTSKIPTPAPGSYNYPAGREAGHPEVFTLWAFIFNYPDLCTDGECGMDDIGPTLAQGGAYNVGGHALGSGGFLNIAGRIGIGDTAAAGVPLSSPDTAEVHTAFAPHGAMDPASLPEEFRMPTGPSNLWWVAIIK